MLYVRNEKGEMVSVLVALDSLDDVPADCWRGPRPILKAGVCEMPSLGLGQFGTSNLPAYISLGRRPWGLHPGADPASDTYTPDDLSTVEIEDCYAILYDAAGDPLYDVDTFWEEVFELELETDYPHE